MPHQLCECKAYSVPILKLDPPASSWTGQGPDNAPQREVVNSGSYHGIPAADTHVRTYAVPVGNNARRKLVPVGNKCPRMDSMTALSLS